MVVEVLVKRAPEVGGVGAVLLRALVQPRQVAALHQAHLGVLSLARLAQLLLGERRVAQSDLPARPAVAALYSGDLRLLGGGRRLDDFKKRRAEAKFLHFLEIQMFQKKKIVYKKMARECGRKLQMQKTT